MKPRAIVLRTGMAFSVLVSLTLSAGNAGGQGTDGGPLTPIIRDAAFIRSELTDTVAARIARLPDGQRLLAFIRRPADFADSQLILPTRFELATLRMIAEQRVTTARPDTILMQENIAVAATARARPPLSETALIYGVTDFVIARMKAELSAAALRQTRRWFARDTVLASLFPTASELVTTSSGDSWSQIPVLRVALKRDLNAFPTASWRVAKASCARRGGCTDPRGSGSIDALRLAAALTESFVKPGASAKAIDYLADVPPSDFLTSTGRFVIRTLAVTANEVASDNGTRFADALRETNAAPYAAVYIARSVLDQSDTSAARIIRTHLGLFAEIAESLDELRDRLEQVEDNGSVASSARLELSGTLARRLVGPAENAAELAIALDLDAAEQFARAFRTFGGIVPAIAGEDYVTAGFLALSAMRSAGIVSSPRIPRWTNFAAALGTARTSEQVTMVVEQFALPPASYLSKRYPEADMDALARVHLNAYFGLAGGVEWLTETSDSVETAAGFAGFSVPIGIELSTRINRLSLFLPLIDLGAVASYRLGDSKSEAAPNVKLANVIAPGLFATISLHRDFPLAIGLGWQYAPRLRRIEGGEEKDASRAGLFIATDIPLFRIR